MVRYVDSMKVLIHRTLGSIRSISALWSLRSLKAGTYILPYKVYHISLQPACSSTFIADVEHYGMDIAKKWSRDACGIASLKIAVESIKRTENPIYQLDTISALSENAVINGAYVDSIGWKHKSLIQLAEKHGLRGVNFVEENIISICQKILENKIVIASVTLYFKGGEKIITNGHEKFLPKGGHLIVLKGFKWNGNSCDGFLYDDCQDVNLHDYAESPSYIDIEKFKKSYSGKVIYLWE